MSPTFSEWSALRAGKITGMLTVPDRSDCPASADPEPRRASVDRRNGLHPAKTYRSGGHPAYRDEPYDTEEAFRLCRHLGRHGFIRLADRAAASHADHTITLTFVRSAQSVGNESGLIDTSVPGPDLTGLGYQQAATAANQLRTNGYDGIYASTMVRAQQTAAPVSEALGKPVTVLPASRDRSMATNSTPASAMPSKPSTAVAI